jgi:hypothetical protein
MHAESKPTLVVWHGLCTPKGRFFPVEKGVPYVLSAMGLSKANDLGTLLHGSDGDNSQPFYGNRTLWHLLGKVNHE